MSYYPIGPVPPTTSLERYLTDRLVVAFQREKELQAIVEDQAATILCVEKNTAALNGLRFIHQYYRLDLDDGGGGPSGADVCDHLFTLMTTLGMPVA